MPAPNAPHPAAGKGGSYIRLSGLPPDYDPLSPDNQRRINQGNAKRDDVELVKEYVDLGITAAKPNVRRPDYEGAIEDLLNQRIQTLYVATVDRFSRRGMGQVGLVLDDLERVGGRIVFDREGLDSAKPNSRLSIAIHSEVARAEAELISSRALDWRATARRKGLWSHRRPFGYLVEDYKLKPHPEEAPIVRRIVEEFLNGASYRSIARGVNDDGIPNPRAFIRAEAEAKGHRLKPMRSDKWSQRAVANLLQKPSLAALISHKRKLVYDEDGVPISCGKGIVTMGERARILAEMEHRSVTVHEAQDSTRVGKRTGGGRPATYLLKGFARCAHCHAALLHQKVRRNSHDYYYYRCSGKAAGEGCRGGSIMAETLDREVVTRFRKRLAACEPGDPLLPVIAKRWMAQAVPESEVERRRLEDALAVVKQTISDLWDDRYQRQLFQTDQEIAEWEQRLKRARSQRDAIQKQKDALGPRDEVDINALLDTELSREAWNETALARKRDLLGLAVNAVLVRGARHGQRPSQDRVVMVWANEDLPGPEPQDGAPVKPREVIAQLVAEERAGKRPRLTKKEAAEIVSVITESYARVLLREERARRAAQNSPDQ